MKIHVQNERDNSIETVKFTGKTVIELLQQLNINKEAVLVIRNNEVITEDEELEDNDKLEFLSVISGG